ncbi:hypothetical protein ACJX0J_020141, partial [Zea mays]
SFGITLSKNIFFITLFSSFISLDIEASIPNWLKYGVEVKMLNNVRFLFLFLFPQGIHYFTM